MKHLLLLILTAGTLLTACATSGEIDKCTRALDNHGKITLNRSLDNDGLQLALETADPVALRTLLMQGFQLHIDSDSGEPIIITFPSARDVSKLVKHHPGEVKATLQEQKEKRPDLRPIVAALNKAEVKIQKGGRSQVLNDPHEVAVNPQNGTLTYSLTLTKDVQPNVPFKVKLLSKPDKEMMGHTEFQQKQPTQPQAPGRRPQPFGADNEQNRPQKIIELTFDFEK